MNELKFSDNIISDLKKNGVSVLTSKPVAGKFINQDVIIETFIIKYNIFKRSFDVVVFNACDSPRNADYYFTIDEYNNCVIDMPKNNSKPSLIIQPGFKDSTRYLK